MDKSRLIPLEFCSISRAAKMLNVEKDDIKHWILTGALRAHIKLSGSSYKGTAITRDKEDIRTNEEGIASISNDYFWGVHHIKMAGFALITKADEINVIKVPGKESVYSLEGLCIASGLWEIYIQDHIEHILLDKEIRSSVIELKPYQDIDRVPKFSIQYRDEIYIDDILITYEDLKEISASIEEQSIPTAKREIINSEDTRYTYLRSDKKISNKQVDLTIALLKSHPEFGGKLSDDPYTAAESILAYFEKPTERNAHTSLSANPRTVARWLGAK